MTSSSAFFLIFPVSRAVILHMVIRKPGRCEQIYGEQCHPTRRHWRSTRSFVCLFCCVWRHCFFFLVLLLLWHFFEQLTYKCPQSGFVSLLYRNSSLSAISMLRFLRTTEHFLRTPISSLTLNMGSWLMCPPHGEWAPWGRWTILFPQSWQCACEEWGFGGRKLHSECLI